MSISTIRLKRSEIAGKVPTFADLKIGELALNVHDADLFAIRNRTGIGSDIVRVGAGASVSNILYVTPDGKDTNSGKKLGDAFKTIKKAVEVSGEGTIIRVSAGTYVEDNPIALPPQLSIVGDSLREVTVIPQNSDDLFYVAPGNYITEMSFNGSNIPGRSVFAFNPNKKYYFNQSPYIRNCTNFIPGSIGLKINGSHANGPTRSMVTDSFTQFNQNGIGVSITNTGYAQLVSLFTICTDTAIYCDSGGACDLTNSNSSFGNFGLVSKNVSPLQYTGSIVNSSQSNGDTFSINIQHSSLGIQSALYDNVTGIVSITTNNEHNFSVGMGVFLQDLIFSNSGGISTYPTISQGYIFDVDEVVSSTSFKVNIGVSTLTNHVYIGAGTAVLNAVRPYDGQVVYFDDLYYSVGRIDIVNPGIGYTTVPKITVDPPTEPWGILCQAVPTVENGSITSVDIISSGRGYTSSLPNISIDSPGTPGGTTAVLSVTLEPTYYSIIESTPISSGITTITVNDIVPYNVGIGTTVFFFKQSRILAASYSFEYIGTGTELNTALPTFGGVPIQENEVVYENGGLVVYTSTDQSGNFRIGNGVVINQQTGTISGDSYVRSLFANVTPYILALSGD